MECYFGSQHLVCNIYACALTRARMHMCKLSCALARIHTYISTCFIQMNNEWWWWWRGGGGMGDASVYAHTHTHTHTQKLYLMPRTGQRPKTLQNRSMGLAPSRTKQPRRSLPFLVSRCHRNKSRTARPMSL